LTTINAAVRRAWHGLAIAKEVRAMFTTNVGNTDRLLRIVLGLVLIALVFVGPKTAWGWIGVVPLITGFLRTCPAYSLFGISTCKAK
jgi:hypothetical protein